MVFELIFFLVGIILVYVYLGYPILIHILGLFIKAPIIKKDIEPYISMVISAYNEEKEIGEKIENSLQLDYPSNKLEIIIVSDASTDNTDQIIKQYISKGVKYIRQDNQQGKTAALNLAVPKANGDFILFTDANAMLRPDAIKKLVRNFADNNTGYVCGLSQYGNRDLSLVGENESTYWDYETKIRFAENKIGSIVGSDGAIYMLRKKLYEPLKNTDINDFVNPLQIIEKGYRGVFEPEAICSENVGVTPGEEYRRKVRIVNRSLNGLMRVKSVMNPFKSGSYSIKIISHKLLRWLSPILLIVLFITNLILMNDNIFYTILMIAQILFYFSAAIGIIFSNGNNLKNGLILKFFYIPFYFLLINIASLVGVWKYLVGDIKVTWQPERAGINN